MNEDTLINDPRKRKQIFQSLMDVKIHSGRIKSYWSLQEELKELECQGKLKIYNGS